MAFGLIPVNPKVPPSDAFSALIDSPSMKPKSARTSLVQIHLE